MHLHLKDKRTMQIRRASALSFRFFGRKTCSVLMCAGIEYLLNITIVRAQLFDENNVFFLPFIFGCCDGIIRNCSELRFADVTQGAGRTTLTRADASQRSAHSCECFVHFIRLIFFHRQCVAYISHKCAEN